MNLKEVFHKTYLKLKSIPVDHPHLESSWLIEKICRLTDLERIQSPEKIINDQDQHELSAAIARRETGEPLAYILNEKEFHGLLFYVDNNVLIPRPETEFLVDWALSWVDKSQKKQFRIADLGTGSGCLGLTLIKKIPEAHLVAIDISAKAIDVAKKNADHLGVTSRVNFFNEDVEKWLHHFGESRFQNQMQFDLIVANPPYIDPDDESIEPNVKKFEPHQALFSNENGLHHIRTWLQAAVQLLAPKGALAFEIGHSQEDQVLRLFRDLGVFSEHYVIRDYNKLARVVCGVKA